MDGAFCACAYVCVCVRAHVCMCLFLSLKKVEDEPSIIILYFQLIL